ncbi:YolD-like family protein [Lederbergia citrea]|uniref:YolD-like family protein n=1 Tax=Lederbergia citrea TaxID=2833581 RepID=UPI003D274788
MFKGLLPLIITLWFDGFFEEVEGVLERVDDINKIVWVRERSNDLHKIDYEKITSVEFID